jgi:hypothetical protein
LHFSQWTPGTLSNVTVKNCLVHAGQNVISNNNPGGIWFAYTTDCAVTNCKVHSLKTDKTGTSYTMQSAGVFSYTSTNLNVTNCTMYGCCAAAPKDHYQQMNISYCYLGWGVFGSGYTGNSDTTSIGGTVHNYLTDTGLTASFHHNIVLGPILGWGESNEENKGLVKIEQAPLHVLERPHRSDGHVVVLQQPRL